MARLSKADELAKVVADLKTFSYNVDAEYYKIPVCVISKDEAEAQELLNQEYPGASVTLIHRGIRCLVSGVSKK